MIAPCAPVLPPRPQGDSRMAPMRSHTSIGHESDPMAFLRPRGDPKNSLSPHAYFHQVVFGGGWYASHPRSPCFRSVFGPRLPRPSARGLSRGMARLTPFEIGRIKAHLHHGLGVHCLWKHQRLVLELAASSAGHTFYISRWSCHLF